MKTLPKALLAATVLLGTAATVATPALAKKKEEAPAGAPQLQVNEKVRAGQTAALAELGKVAPLAPGGVINASNQGPILAAINAAEPHIAAMEAAATTPDEQYVANEMRYRKDSLLISVTHPTDAAARAQAAVRLAPVLDKLLAYPQIQPKTVADYANERGQIAMTAKEYRPAIGYFERARAAGSTDILNDAYIVNAKILMGDYAGAAADSTPLIARYKAAGRRAPEPFYAVGIENAYRSKNLAQATQLELVKLADYPDAKNYHDALTRLSSRGATPLDTRQRMDVWRLMRATKSLADEKERQMYAGDALEVGASREAQAVIEEFRAGRAATSLDPKTQTLLADANRRVAQATSPAKAEADARAASDAQSALTAGNFNYAAGNYAKAAELYQLAQQRGAPDKDLLLMSLGAAQAQAGDKATATATFQQVASTPRKEIAAYWLAWLARP